MPQTGTQEYTDLYRIITNKQPNDDSQTDVYQELMKREQRVLQTIDRIVEQKEKEKLEINNILDVPLRRLPLEILRTVSDIIDEFLVARPDGSLHTRIYAILSKDQRLIHIGVLCIVVSVILMFLQNSSSETE